MLFIMKGVILGQVRLGIALPRRKDSIINIFTKRISSVLAWKVVKGARKSILGREKMPWNTIMLFFMDAHAFVSS
jgi:hypothetical protein